MPGNELFAITLYVPDETMRVLNERGRLRGLPREGACDLDFITPAWWEGSHTVRLGLIPAENAEDPN